jgi:predicted metal-binding membrane protein
MSSASFVRAFMMALTMSVMMVPSIAPALRRHHRALATAGVRTAGRRTAAVGFGYAAMWTAAGLALFALDATLRGQQMSAMGASFAPAVTGAVFLCAGALQCSRWKANLLSHCRDAFSPACTVAPRSIGLAWQSGCRLGARCVSSCIAPTAILFVVGLMDVGAMAVITGAIFAERLAADGLQIARLTGALALGAGLVICARAIGMA